MGTPWEKSRRQDQRKLRRRQLALFAGAVLVFWLQSQNLEQQARAATPASEVVVGPQDRGNFLTRDPIRATMLDVLDETYELTELGRGRYLRDRKAGIGFPFLAGVDLDTLSCVRRGGEWIIVKAPCEYEEMNEPRRGHAHLRFEREDGTWKLEHAKFLRGDGS